MNYDECCPQFADVMSGTNAFWMYIVCNRNSALSISNAWFGTQHNGWPWYHDLPEIKICTYLLYWTLSSVLKDQHYSPLVRVFGCGRKPELPDKNPCRHGEKKQSPHRTQDSEPTTSWLWIDSTTHCPALFASHTVIWMLLCHRVCVCI